MNRKSISILLLLFTCQTETINTSTTITTSQQGTIDGLNWELWKDYGTTQMTLDGGGNFSCKWSNIGNALFRIGKKFDCTQTWQQLGTIKVDYSVDYQPNGNSYMCVYGWTRNPLIEYYIVDSWGTWRPPGTTSLGTVTVDGQTYDVYTSDRINQPSIDGYTTFKQFWSVNRNKRTSGTITVSEHFKAWGNFGLNLGYMYEASFTIEGYQSSGYAKVNKNVVTVG